MFNFEQFLQISGPTLNETLRRASICQRLQKETSICWRVLQENQFKQLLKQINIFV